MHFSFAQTHNEYMYWYAQKVEDGTVYSIINKWIKIQNGTNFFSFTENAGSYLDKNSIWVLDPAPSYENYKKALFWCKTFKNRFFKESAHFDQYQNLPEFSRLGHGMRIKKCFESVRYLIVQFRT